MTRHNLNCTMQDLDDSNASANDGTSPKQQPPAQPSVQLSEPQPRPASPQPPPTGLPTRIRSLGGSSLSLQEPVESFSPQAVAAERAWRTEQNEAIAAAERQRRKQHELERDAIRMQKEAIKRLEEEAAPAAAAAELAQEVAEEEAMHARAHGTAVRHFIHVSLAAAFGEWLRRTESSKEQRDVKARVESEQRRKVADARAKEAGWASAEARTSTLEKRRTEVAAWQAAVFEWARTRCQRSLVSVSL